MNSEEIAAQLASLNTGAKFTGKTLDRFERDFERIDSEIKALKDEKAQIEKQYAGIFSELQHKLNEIEELQTSIHNIADDMTAFKLDCASHKEATKDKTTWQTIKADPIKALKIVGVFFVAIVIGSIIGWDRFFSWLIKQTI